MSATQTDPRPHLSAIVAALNVTLAPNKAYPLDAIPGTSQNAVVGERTKPLPNMYVEVGLEPRYVPPAGMVPRSSRGSWRIATVCVGRSINEVGWVVGRVEDALRNQHLVVEGERIGPVVRESATRPEWDDIRWSSLILWRYSH